MVIGLVNGEFSYGSVNWPQVRRHDLPWNRVMFSIVIFVFQKYFFNIILSSSVVIYSHWWIQGGARDVRPSLGPNSFIFRQFSAKILPNNRFCPPPNSGFGAPFWEILDSSLILFVCYLCICNILYVVVLCNLQRSFSAVTGRWTIT